MRIALASRRNLPATEVDDQPLVQALERAGAHVDVVPWDADADWTRYTACLIRSTWDYMERRDEFVAWAKAVGRVSRLFNPPEVVAWNTVKTYLRELAARGLPLADTTWLPAGERVDLRARLASATWARGILKPWIGAAARETLAFTRDAAGLAKAQAHADRLLPREGLMVQPFLASVEREGEYSVLFVEGEMTHGVRKVPVPGDYRVMDDFGARDEPWVPPPADLALAVRARVAAEAIANGGEPLLYARVDLLRGDDGALLVNEVELVEPSFFFRHGRHAAERLAVALLARLG